MVEIFQNIRGLYTFAAAQGELAQHVEFFSESDPLATQLYAGSNSFSVKMFPSWTPTFYINLGSPYQIFSSGKWSMVGAGEDILLLRDSVVERHNHPTDNIFTVKFHPGGLKAVLGIDPAKCAGGLVPLDQLLPSRLLAQLKGPVDFSQRTKLMQDYLLAQLKKNTQGDHYLQLVGQAIGKFSESGMQLNTDQVAQRIFLSSKTINRYFHRVVGTSPKQYFSVLRARTALTAYLGDKDGFSPQAYGYYDPSHFSRSVFQFTETRLRSAQGR